MSTTHALPQARGTAPVAPAVVRSFLLRRLAPAALGIAGALVVVYGVSLAWISTFAGLISQSGWGTRNGDLLTGGAVAAGVLAVASLAVRSNLLRWAVAITGFALVAFAGYLLIQLYTVVGQLDGMTVGQKGPGLFVATAGAAAVFATIFLPMPVDRRDRGMTDDSRMGASSLTAPAVPAFESTELSEPQGRVASFLLQALVSPLRYPVALLALAAGLAHVPVTPEHLQEAPYIGVLFIVLTIVCALGAAALLLNDSPAVWLAIGGTCLLAVIAYIWSRTIGLPEMSDDIGNWFEGLGVVSVLTESGAAALSAVVLWRHRRGSQRLRESQPH